MMMQHSPKIFLLSGIYRSLPFLMLCFASVAMAQRSTLDDVEFIRGLQERRMTSLIDYYIESNPQIDEVVKLETRLSLSKMDASIPHLSATDRIYAISRVEGNYDRLLRLAPQSHWKRPLWAVDMVAHGYGDKGHYIYAYSTLFVEFGVAIPMQQRSFGKLVHHNYDLITMAQRESMSLADDIKKQTSVFTDVLATGNWRRVVAFTDYVLPYYRALTLRYISLLDANQRDKITGMNDVEFTQLLESTEAELKRMSLIKLLRPEIKGRIILLRGRICLALQRYPEAIAAFQSVYRNSESYPIDQFIALLAISQAYQAQGGAVQIGVSYAQAALAVLKSERIESPLLLMLAYSREWSLSGDKNIWEKLLEEPMIKSDPRLRADLHQWIQVLIAGKAIKALRESWSDS